MEDEKKPVQVVPGHVGYAPDYKSSTPAGHATGGVLFGGEPGSLFAGQPPTVESEPSRSTYVVTDAHRRAARVWLKSVGANPELEASLARLFAMRDSLLIEEIVDFVDKVDEDWEPGRIAKEISARWGQT